MKRLLTFSAALLLGGLLTSCERTAPDPSPYAGEEKRAIKTLSEARIQGLLAGEGLGYAMVAELNGYPGPRHVLELASELDMTENQRTRTHKVYDRMHESATRLGRELVSAERVLDSLFAAGGSVDSTAVVEAMRHSGRLVAQIRWTHVEAHLRQTEILNQHQRHLYSQLRGYESVDGHQQDPSHQHEHGM